MATRGRKPKATTVKILEGSRPDRINWNAPGSISGPLEPPDHLDEVARAKWDEIVPKLEAMGVLSQTDSDVVALYCVAYSEWLEARREVKRHGLVMETDLGGVKANPAVAIRAKCADQMKQLLPELGCTPSSRGRLDRLKSDAPPDEFEGLLSSKPKQKA